MTVGEKIRKYRTQNGLSQKALGEACHMSEPAIRNYELGNRHPGKEQLEKIAKALGISVFAISDPDLDSEDGVMHALFALESAYGFRIKKTDLEVGLVCDDESMQARLDYWSKMHSKFKDGEITDADYKDWQATYTANITK